ncbi:hypothetical protein GOP47_0006015 [Adiantum capillus-veneris]|uniref:Phytocyanin domain-containing protein n=1 Tax=Adiantum capillus-veneris TaxID=13818 RepID=A0A9D4V252_ADICA|nr:hypothetical protein GOP47_0006015 [Adiantum capillus-veneris]
MASLLLLSLLSISFLSCVPLSFATVYTVGGPAGWTTPSRAKVNYTDWAANTLFKVGDTLEFNYVPKAHTVLEVTRSDFRYCNKSNPLVKYEDPSGTTAIELAKVGNYYFIDGVGEHCEEGQKFQAKVQSSPSGSISSSPSSGGFAPTLAPSTLSPSLQPAPSPAGAIPPAIASAPPSTTFASNVAYAVITFFISLSSLL